MNATFVKVLCGKIGTAGRIAAVVGILPGLFFETASAQTKLNSPARLETFSKLPDWNGVWRLKGSPALYDVEDGKSFVPGVRDHPRTSRIGRPNTRWTWSAPSTRATPNFRTRWWTRTPYFARPACRISWWLRSIMSSS